MQYAGITDQNKIDNWEYSTMHDTVSGAESLKCKRDIFSAIAKSLSILNGICAHRIDRHIDLADMGSGQYFDQSRCRTRQLPEGLLADGEAQSAHRHELPHQEMVDHERNGA